MDMDKAEAKEDRRAAMSEALQLAGVAAGVLAPEALRMVLSFDVTALKPRDAERRWQAAVALTKGLTRANVSAHAAPSTVAVVLPLHDWLVCCFDISQQLARR